MSFNDIWVRDSGPTFVIDGHGHLRVVKWDFNAWGGLDEGLYFPWHLDDLVGYKIAELEGVDFYHPESFVMEGGSFDADGEGTLLVTEECLLNHNRNPHLTCEQIAELLGSYLGVDKIIWLSRGVYKDETNGHVDNFCRFVRPGAVALTWTDDKSDPQYEISAEAHARLSRLVDARGRRLEINKIHQPDPIFMTPEEYDSLDVIPGNQTPRPGDRLPASYLNFYLPNRAVVYPTFGDSHDQAAGEVFSRLFPDREVIPFNSSDVIPGGGNIHCVTQQVPAR
jgi:agmatine deiminase